jgi:hypothetical protein
MHSKTIVIKPGLEVDQAKGSGPRFYGSTRINLEKLKKDKILIFYMKKLRKNPCKYRNLTLKKHSFFFLVNIEYIY